MKFLARTLPFLLLLLSASCVGNEAVAITITPSLTVQPTEEIKATQSSTPTRSAENETVDFLSPTPTPAFTPTSVQSAAFTIEQHCIDPALSIPSEFVGQGTIIYQKGFENDHSQLVNLKTGTIISLPEKYHGREGRFLVSKDYHYFAYESVSPAGKQIVIADSTGKTIKTIPWDTSWRNSMGWLNQDKFMISKLAGEGKSDSIVIYNLITDEIKELPAPADQIVTLGGASPWNEFATSLTIYNNELSRSVYLDYREYPSLVLIDVKTGKEIGSAPTEYRYPPQWLPDGSKFIFISSPGVKSKDDDPKELFSMDRDGKVEQITHFNDQYPDQKVRIKYVSISPDGDKVAFWVSLFPSIQYPILP